MNEISRVEASKSTWQDIAITAGFLTALVTAVAVYIIVSCNTNNYDAAFFAHPGTICVFVGWGACLATTVISSIIFVRYWRDEAALKELKTANEAAAALAAAAQPAAPAAAPSAVVQGSGAVAPMPPAPPNPHVSATPAATAAPAPFVATVISPPPKTEPKTEPKAGSAGAALPPPPPPRPPRATPATTPTFSPNGPGFYQPPHTVGAATAAAPVASASAGKVAENNLYAMVAAPFLDEVRDLMVEWLHACYRMCWAEKVKEQAPTDDIELATHTTIAKGKVPKMTVLEMREAALKLLFDAEFRNKMANTFLNAATTLSNNQKTIMYVYLPHTYVSDPKDHYKAFVGLEGAIKRIKATPPAELGPVAQSMCQQLKGFLEAFVRVTKKPAPMENVRPTVPPVDELLNGTGFFKAVGGLLNTLTLEPHNGNFIGIKTRLGAAARLGLLGSDEEIRVAKLTFLALMSQYHAAFTNNFPKFRAQFNQLVINHVENGLVPALVQLEVAKGNQMTFEDVLRVFGEHCRAMGASFKQLGVVPAPVASTATAAAKK